MLLLCICYRDDIRGHINKLRETRQSLTGLKVVELKNQIIEQILLESGAQSVRSKFGVV